MKHVDPLQFFNATTWLRGLAIVGVLMIHATAPVIEPRYHLPTSGIAPLIALNQASRFSVPLFFFISGLIYGFMYAKRNIVYFSFLWKRFSKILIPYTFWVCFYLSIRLVTDDMNISVLTPKYLFLLYVTGGAAGHLYFIPAIFQFYLLLPYLLQTVKTISTGRRQLVFWSGYLAIMLGLLHLRITSGMEHPVASLFCRSYWFYWWAPFALLGLQLGHLTGNGTHPKIPKALLTASILILLPILCHEYMMAYRQAFFIHRDVAAPFSNIATFLRPSAFLYALACCLLCYGLVIVKHLPMPMFFRSLGACSFGIYLIHPFINKCLLKAGKIFSMDLTGTLWSVALFFLIGSSLSFLLVRSCRTIHFCEYIFGPTR